MRHPAILAAISLAVAVHSVLAAQTTAPLPAGQKWAATWAASVHGPYPSGNPSAQPDLKFAFPAPAEGAVDQSFRLIVKPDLWGDRFRIRLANTFGTQAIAFSAIYIGVSSSGGTVVKGTNRRCTSTARRASASHLAGRPTVTPLISNCRPAR